MPKANRKLVARISTPILYNITYRGVIAPIFFY
nr:MAG TPA: hypothetical protein [Caudoviricetes sp.]